MITGDHADTALAIARELGLAADGDRVLTGRQLAALDEDSLRAAVREVDVFARVDLASGKLPHVYEFSVATLSC